MPSILWRGRNASKRASGCLLAKLFLRSDSPGWVTQTLGRGMPCTEACGGSFRMRTRTNHGECRPGTDANFMLPRRDALSWTALMVQNVKCGQGREALKMYQKMRMAGVDRSSYTFVAALKACSSLQDLESTKEIHTDLMVSGLGFVVNLGNVLVDVYVKCGSLADARHVFEKMPHRDVVSWNTMILGCAQMEEGEEALQLYDRMQQEGVAPDNRTYVAALKACSSLVASEEGRKSDGILMKRRCLEQVKAIHSTIGKSGSESALFVGTMLVDVYGKCGSLMDARCVFENMPHRNVVSWNALISGYAQMEEATEALQLYARMQQEGVVPDHRTFVAALRACSSLVALDDGSAADVKHVESKCLDVVRGIHADIEKAGFESDVYVWTMLVDVYGKCGSLVEAKSVFEKIPHRNVVSWNAMIFGYAQMEEGEEALQLYARMQDEGVLPNDRTFVGALRACSSMAANEEGSKTDGIHVKKKCLAQVRIIHSHISKSGYESDVFVATMLVDVYAKCGSLVDAKHVFQKMRHRNVVSWNAMIIGYAQMDEGDKALQLFALMQQDHMLPDRRTFVGALMACGAVVGLEKGREIHAQICKAGLQGTDLFVPTTLIDMYGKCGNMVSAQEVFDALPSRNVVTWNALIAGYAHQGQSELIFQLFKRMRQEGIQPNGVTFLSILTVCSHAGLVGEGQMYFEAMRSDYGIRPAVDHYNCLVDLLGRAGQVEKAMAVVRIMPFTPDAAVWQTVLGACRKWCDVKIGRQAFEYAVALDKDDASAYVLMSNLYEAANMLKEAKEIQAMRLKTRTWKKPGQSWWTDMGGLGHAFLVGDRDHPESQVIYGKLKDLFVVMKEGEYLSPPEIVSQYTSDDKDDLYCLHSKKLATAYAVLKTMEVHGTSTSVISIAQPLLLAGEHASHDYLNVGDGLDDYPCVHRVCVASKMRGKADEYKSVYCSKAFTSHRTCALCKQVM